MSNINIDLSKYITEEEKKEIAINVFKERVERELFKGNKGTVQSDSEIQRIIGNISHEIVVNEVSKHIPDFESKIKDKVSETIQRKDFSYEVFRKKDAWGTPQSLAVTIIKKEIEDQQDFLKDKIKEAIKNYDASKDVSNKISSLFEEMSYSLSSLSELFIK